jgi:hypothetical protein
MANYGSKDTIIELTDASAVYHDISAHVRTFNGIDVENLTQEVHGFGETWVKNLWTGMSKVNDITFEGFYSDTTNTPAQLYARGALRSLRVTWGGGKTTTTDVIMSKFSRDPKLGELTHYKMVLKPASDLVDA